MWAVIATAATTVLAAHSSAAFEPPDCVRAVPHHTQNGDMVIATKKPGLWLAAANGAIKRRLTNNKSDSHASFSPDAHKVVFQRYIKSGHYAIFTYDLRTGRTRRLFAAKRHDELVDQPLWSPDGRWIAFMHETIKGDDYRTDVALVHPNGKALHDVHRVSHLTNIPTLAWSRNGACIAYQWGSFDQGALAIQNADFTEGVNLIPFGATFPDGAEIFIPEDVAFSADGKLLYVTFPVTVSKKDSDRIYAIRMDTPAEPILVAKNAVHAIESPDGRWLAYATGDRWTHIRQASRRSGGRRFLHGFIWDWAPKH
jgi:Tol biopolymer transport system component